MTKLNFVARHYDPCVQGNSGHNGVRQNSTWPISTCGDPYDGLLRLHDSWLGTFIFEAFIYIRINMFVPNMPIIFETSGR